MKQLGQGLETSLLSVCLDRNTYVYGMCLTEWNGMADPECKFATVIIVKDISHQTSWLHSKVRDDY